MTIARVLVIAGSDSGGGAGIQADIKTITMLGGHAMTAITAITAQNSMGVQGVHPVPVAMVLDQIDAVLSDLGADAIKIGMIGSAQTAHAVADLLASSFPRREPPSFPRRRESISQPVTWTQGQEMDPRLRGDDGKVGGNDGELGGGPGYYDASGIPIIFDPVMVATSGALLADTATVAAFERLMAMAFVITPNVPELAALTGMDITNIDTLEEAGQILARRHGCAVLAKGGHLGDQPGDDVPSVHDLLIRASGVSEYRMPRIRTMHSHGTGCTLASAVATGIAHGLTLENAVDRAEAFVAGALYNAPGIGEGHGPMGHAMDTTPFYHTLAAVNLHGEDAQMIAARWGDIA